MKRFKTLKNLFNASIKDLQGINLIDQKIITNILNPQNRILAKKHLIYMEKNSGLRLLAGACHGQFIL